MLYITTRNNRDAYTAPRALAENRGPDGGMYLPFRAPFFTFEDLEAMALQSFGQTVAKTMNLLLGTSLTAWDIEFAAGRAPVRMRQLPHQIIVAELWHNPREEYAGLERSLSSLVRQGEPQGWVRLAIRAAVLCGIYGQLRRQGIPGAELVLLAGDFAGSMAAWYARQWGLGIGSIVSVCNENRELWNLLTHGQLRTDAVCVNTPVPQADVAVPEELERLVYEGGGASEVQRFLDICRRGGVYCPDDAVMARMSRGMKVSVVSTHRIYDTIPGAYRTHSYLLSSEGALVYGGLLDFRAKSHVTSWAVMLEDRSPMLEKQMIAQLLDVPESELIHM